MMGLKGEIEYYRSRTRQLERAMQKILDTPAPASMTAEQFKNRISGGAHEALHILPKAPAVTSAGDGIQVEVSDERINVSGKNIRLVEETMSYVQQAIAEANWRDENEGYVR